jgi:hypothetical protein
MPDLKLAAQDAIFDKLNGTGAITAIGPVWQHPPDGLEPPYTLIGAMNATPFGGKDGGLDNIEVEILTVVRQPGREHLTPLMTAVRDALEGAALTATTCSTTGRPMWARSGSRCSPSQPRQRRPL